MGAADALLTYRRMPLQRFTDQKVIAAIRGVLPILTTLVPVHHSTGSRMRTRISSCSILQAIVGTM